MSTLLVSATSCNLGDPISERNFPDTSTSDTSTPDSNTTTRDTSTGDDLSPDPDTGTSQETRDGEPDEERDTDITDTEAPDDTGFSPETGDAEPDTLEPSDTQDVPTDGGQDTDTAPTCSDGIENGDETDVDCGGSCAPCSTGASCSSNSDCSGDWCRSDTCSVRIEGSLSLAQPGRWSNGDLAETCEEYRRPTENNYHYTSATGAPGNGIYEIEPDPSKTPLEVYCDMDRDDGGWTLVIVSADDGTTLWTWNNRKLFSTNSTNFGSPANRSQDFKSRAYHDIEFRDALFVHNPSDKWLSYADVGDGSQSFAELTDQTGETCYADPGRTENVEPGFPKSSGNVSATDDLCSTDLYLNPRDQDGSDSCGDDDHAFGPAWSANQDGAGCPFDDPGESTSLGPNFEKQSTEEDNRGFATPIGVDSNGDALLMYVR